MKIFWYICLTILFFIMFISMLMTIGLYFLMPSGQWIPWGIATYVAVEGLNFVKSTPP